jgi:hypothetical protein
MNEDFEKYAWMVKYGPPKDKDLAGCKWIHTSVCNAMNQMKRKSTY